MKNENNTDYQYNRCTSRGICSINPATASLQEIILLYLKYAAYYGIKLNENGKKDKRISNLILNTLSLLGSNYEISEPNFDIINSAFKEELPRVKKLLNEISSDIEDFDIETLLQPKNNLNEYIKFGEEEFNKRIQNMQPNERSLYRMLFVLVKSLCINILIYESYEQEPDEEISVIFKVLNLFNSPQKTKEELKKLIQDVSRTDCDLMNKISVVREERYGEQEEEQVSFSTKKGKAVLVVGSNIKELEQILDVFSDKDIDIYTHDNMIIAHTFPKFREYKNLKGQFGKGMENCLLDFSTFPGPIILTRYSLFNIENLYRGRLFTTDFSYSKGVIKIRNNDFSEVIKSAEDSKGFKTGKNCESERVGFSIKKAVEMIKESLSADKYEQVVVLAPAGHSTEEKEYFNTLIKHLPSNVLIISLFCCDSYNNVICVNASNDIYGVNRLIDELFMVCEKKLTLFYSYIDRHTLSVLIKSACQRECGIFVGNRNQYISNPNIIEVLKTEFKVFEVTSPKNDINKILNIK